MYAENTGQVEEFITILKKRKWQIALPAVFILALSMVLALIIPGKYVIESKLELRRQRIIVDSANKEVRNTTTTSEAANAADHLKSYELVRRVLTDLAWDEYANLRDPVLKREYIRNQVRAINAVTPAESKLNKSLFVTLSYKHVDPLKGVQFIEELVRSWIKDLTSRDVNTLRRERDDEQNAVESLRTKYQDAAMRVADFEKDMRITSSSRPDLPGFQRSADRFEQAIANVLVLKQSIESEKAGKDAEMVDIMESLRTMEDTVARTVSERPSDRAAIAAGHQQDIDDLRAQQVGLTPQHSKFKRIQKKIEALEVKLFEVANSTETVIITTEAVPNEAKIVLEKRKATLELELKGLNASYDRLLLREAELESVMDERLRLQSQHEEAEHERDLYQEQLTEAKMLLHNKERELASQVRANMSPFHWTKRPTAPPDPTEPNPFLIIALGLVGGLAVGLGSSVVVEFSKNCFRNVGDVTAVVTLPVLGVVNEIVTSQERRSMRVRASVMVCSSVLMLTVIGWFTWAYTRNQELLPTTVLVQLEEFRNQFE